MERPKHDNGSARTDPFKKVVFIKHGVKVRLNLRIFQSNLRNLRSNSTFFVGYFSVFTSLHFMTVILVYQQLTSASLFTTDHKRG